MRTASPSNSNLRIGILYILIAFLFMAFYGVLTKIASANSSTIWISFISYLTAFICLLPIVFKNGLASLKTKQINYHLGRAIFGLAASFSYLIAMHYIPLVNATLLFNTTPLFIPIIATFWLKWGISKSTWWSILVGFIGIIIIIKPTANILKQPADIIGLWSGISLAIAYLFVKLLSKTENAIRINFYFFLISTLIQLPFTFFAPLPHLYNIGMAIASGITFVLAQLFLVKAYELASASKIGVFQYATIIFVAIIDWLIWGLIPPLSDFFGALLVILAGIIIIRSGEGSQVSKEQEN